MCFPYNANRVILFHIQPIFKQEVTLIQIIIFKKGPLENLAHYLVHILLSKSTYSNNCTRLRQHYHLCWCCCCQQCIWSCSVGPASEQRTLSGCPGTDWVWRWWWSSLLHCRGPGLWSEPSHLLSLPGPEYQEGETGGSVGQLEETVCSCLSFDRNYNM